MNEGDELQTCILSTTATPRGSSLLPTPPLVGGVELGVREFFFEKERGVRGASGENVEYATLNLRFPHKFSAANTKLSIAAT